MYKLFVSLSLCLLLGACASHYGAAKIVSTPPGAEVISDEDGSVLGVTPTTVWWKDGSKDRQHVILRFKKQGYYEKVSSFWLSMRHRSLANAKESAQLVEVVMDDDRK